MHDIDIPQWVVDRVIAKRGAEHVFTDLDPAKTALIVIDMQNAFMLPGVGFADIKTAPEIVPNINRLPELGAKRRDALAKGSEGHQIWRDLDVLDGDPIIEKTKFSALVPGSSGLDAYLKARGIDTLIITGCLTDVCSESTSRDAMMLNYRIILVTDANAADTTFGDVMPTDMVVGLLVPQ
jgi:ureidoacrylate peracid hydrolase